MHRAQLISTIFHNKAKTLYQQGFQTAHYLQSLAGQGFPDKHTKRFYFMQSLPSKTGMR